MVRSSNIDTAEVVVGRVTEVTKDTFWPIVEAAGDKAVVLDMYTQWYVYDLNLPPPPFFFFGNVERKCFFASVQVRFEVVLVLIVF